MSRSVLRARKLMIDICVLYLYRGFRSDLRSRNRRKGEWKDEE